MKKDSKDSKKKGIWLFWGIAIISLILFIGYDYIKLYSINLHPKYTIGVVTKFTSRARTYDNQIDYYYTVNGHKYTHYYQSGRLPLNLQGKRILIKYSNDVKRWNVPFYNEIIPDSVPLGVDFMNPDLTKH
jgi:hypothetical protein